MKRIFAAALLFFALACTSAKEIAVLTIGNSFAQSVFVYLPSIVKSAPGCSLHLEGANLGGCSLSLHWRHISEEEKDPSVKHYRNGKATMRQILQSRKWDIITIQQASHESWRPETYFPYAEKLCDYIVYIHGGKVVLGGEKDELLRRFVIYPYRAGSPAPGGVRILKREFGADVLGERRLMPAGAEFRQATLEDIMLFYSKGDKI